MIHGYPDTHRLWDAQVAHLQGRYRCARFTLPGFDLSKPPRAMSQAQIVALIAAVVDCVSPNQPVTLLMHDWGSHFGFQFAAHHPRRVARIISVDIGDTSSAEYRRSLSIKSKWEVLRYQVWLALAWKLGGDLGNRMVRYMARERHCPTVAGDQIGWQMAYPYAMRFGACGGMGDSVPYMPHCPVLYVYGERKSTMWHSPKWLETVSSLPGGRVRGFATGHWPMVEQPGPFNQCVSDWLGHPGDVPTASRP